MLGAPLRLSAVLSNGVGFFATWLASLGSAARSPHREDGQTTAEYALVILAAAAVAIVLIAWARSSGKLPAFFDKIIDEISQVPP
jgi:Flp pilus assembly pilin Flp